MIEVRGLTKRFGAKTAVDDVRFGAAKGELIGVLGPNGAGKTTTLRMLCGYLPPSSGTALVDGIDVVRDSLGARRRLGYLPENVPLYPEMTVREYLSFRAALKRLPRGRKADAIAGVVERCALSDRLGQTIGTLSKGYRQRVGLADALLGAPPLLVLDEPTVGLDPNQVIQTRALIQSLRGDHTVLLSSHILSEVEQICDRVVIFRQGRVVADQSPAELFTAAGLAPTITLELPATRESELSVLIAGLARASRSEPLPDGWLRVELQSESDVRAALFERAAAAGVVLRELTRRSLSLEQVFHELTTERRPDAAQE